MFAGFANALALLGLAAAVLLAVISAALRRIGPPFLGFLLIEVGAAALLLWLAAKLVKNPF